MGRQRLCLCCPFSQLKGGVWRRAGAGVNTTRVGGVVRWSDVSRVLSFGRGPFFCTSYNMDFSQVNTIFFLFMTYSIYDLLTCDLRTGSAVT